MVGKEYGALWHDRQKLSFSTSDGMSFTPLWFMVSRTWAGLAVSRWALWQSLQAMPWLPW